jgi:hypothetical protein
MLDERAFASVGKLLGATAITVAAATSSLLGPQSNVLSSRLKVEGGWENQVCPDARRTGVNRYEAARRRAKWPVGHVIG